MLIATRISCISCIFCLCLSYSTQYLQRLAWEQGLSYSEVESLREYEKHEFERQAKEAYILRSGIQQTKICGINGKSSSRSNEQTKPQCSEDWPWMAVLLLKGDKIIPFCGGSLLNSRYVLTAAHCFTMKETMDKNNFLVRLGEYDLNNETDTEVQNFDIEKLIMHEDYDRGNQQYDIALLKLNDTVKYTRYVRPICLPNADPEPDRITYVAGWGKVTYNATNANAILLYADIPVWDHKQCKEALIGKQVHNTNICASSHTAGKDSCQGDSGGPLMYQGKGKRWENVGVVSWGEGCGEPCKPGIYTSVSKYLPWIKIYVEDASP